jgi:DNA-directed RNA polymerase sigma subunit (sigma70/sigma32)
MIKAGITFVTLDELSGLTGISRERLRKIINHLAVKDKVCIASKREFPYGFYFKGQNL